MDTDRHSHANIKVSLRATGLEGTFNPFNNTVRLASSNNVDAEFEDKILGKTTYRTTNLAILARRLMCSNIYEVLPHRRERDRTKQELMDEYGISEPAAGLWFWDYSPAHGDLDIVLHVNEQVYDFILAETKKLEVEEFRNDIIALQRYGVGAEPLDPWLTPSYYEIMPKKNSCIYFTQAIRADQLNAAVTRTTGQVFSSDAANSRQSSWGAEHLAALVTTGKDGRDLPFKPQDVSAIEIMEARTLAAEEAHSIRALEQQTKATQTSMYGAGLAAIVVMLGGWMFSQQITAMNDQMGGMNTNMLAMNKNMGTIPEMAQKMDHMQELPRIRKSMGRMTKSVRGLDLSVRDIRHSTARIKRSASEFSRPMERLNTFNPLSW